MKRQSRISTLPACGGNMLVSATQSTAVLIAKVSACTVFHCVFCMYYGSQDCAIEHIGQFHLKLASLYASPGFAAVVLLLVYVHSSRQSAEL